MGYVELARLLGPEQPFYGLQARGWEGDQEPHTRIEDMAAYYAEAIRRQQARGPYHLGGYCYGGVVAFEVARQLEALGEQVALLAIFEGYAPRGAASRSPFWPPRATLSFLGNLPFWMRDLLQRPDAFRRLSERLRAKNNGQAAAGDRDWEIWVEVDPYRLATRRSQR